MSASVNLDLPLIIRLLLEAEKLDEDQLELVRRVRVDHPESVEQALVVSAIVHEQTIARAYAAHMGLPWIDQARDDEDETTTDIDLELAVCEHVPEEQEPVSMGTVGEIVSTCGEMAKRISEVVCRKHRVIPVRFDAKTVDLACLNPADFAAVEEVSMRTGLIVRPRAITLTLLKMITGAFFGERDVVREIMSETAGATLLTDGGDDDDDMQFVLDLSRPIPAGRDSQVVRIVNVLLSRAVEEGASDIHIEPYEDQVRVRYRIDGKLVETTPPPRSLFIPTISRLKILAKMDIAEKRVPQDGAIALKTGPKRVDLRVSTVPTVYGEKMVIRLLEKEGIPDRLEKLGFSEPQAQAFIQAAESPNGLMFVTGPTGSGKSTTLYCCLTLINKPTENIVTVEDPVEYKFYGLNQVHVKAAVGLTFSSALRAFLRQDPDKIMVGEVRDQETAQICMRAALTGHLVLSTLHTNDSLQVINRLVDMGVEPFLLGPALRLLEAQRLARRLCPDCKEAYELPEEVAERYGLEPGITLYRKPDERGNHCDRCRGNGTKGRVGVYEVVPIGENLRTLIGAQAPMSEVKAAAKAEGVKFLADSARDKLMEGVTALEEVSEYVRVD